MFIFLSKPRQLTPQNDHLGKTSPILRVSTHIYGVSKEIDGKNMNFPRKPSYVTPQIDHLGKTSPVLRVPTPIYGVTQEIDGKMFISIVKAHTIKWQIYPSEVFYAKDLLPIRVTISFFSSLFMSTGTVV